MKRYFIYFAYSGEKYCGWQAQSDGFSVQQCMEEALSVILRSEIAVTAAGRTDAGVHARRMVAHFDDVAEAVTDPADLVYKLNSFLPADIAIHCLLPVRPDAHARFAALSRTYKYYLVLHKDPFRQLFAYRLRGDVDFAAMNVAAAALLSYTDFTSFSKLHTQVRTNNCRISHARWEQEEGMWTFTITADRFLRNMVRAIVGTLLEVGRGRLDLDGFRRIIDAKDRSLAGESVPANALFLHDITYPEYIFS